MMDLYAGSEVGYRRDGQSRNTWISKRGLERNLLETPGAGGGLIWVVTVTEAGEPATFVGAGEQP